MNKNDQEYLVSKIRTQYTEKENTKLDELKSLDSKVKKPANILAYTLGVVGAIIMGGGMSIVMTDIGETVGIENPMLVGVLLGVIGMLMVIINYPIYKNVLASRRKKYADRIITISDEIMNG